MAEPFLRVEIQRHGMDCAVACLAMVTGASYGAALLAFGDELLHGAQTRQIQAAARKLGQPLTLKRKVDLDIDSGLLAVRSPLWKADHLVVLREGVIVDTDGSIWFEPDVFLSAYRARTISLLAL